MAEETEFAMGAEASCAETELVDGLKGICGVARRSFIPASAGDQGRDGIWLNLTKEQVEDLPAVG